jgi:hypothetical protein
MSDKNLNTVSKDQAQTPAFMRPSAGTWSKWNILWVLSGISQTGSHMPG